MSAADRPDVITRVKDPGIFAKLCRHCEVPHPDICHQRPDDAAGWLLKRAGDMIHAKRKWFM